MSGTVSRVETLPMGCSMVFSVCGLLSHRRGVAAILGRTARDLRTS